MFNNRNVQSNGLIYTWSRDIMVYKAQFFIHSWKRGVSITIK